MNKTESNESLLARAKQAYESENLVEALRDFTFLGERDDPEACQYLGLMYRTGDGVPKDDAKAGFWYSKYAVLLKRGADAGNLDALLDLGKLYQYGQIVGLDEQKALAFIERAATAGHAGAQFHLATLYRHGWCGLAPDERLCEEWLVRAVNAGHAEAMYIRGLDLLKDQSAKDKGIALIVRAAEKGFWPAKDYLVGTAARSPL